MRSNKPHHGFTLIELLVVISIVALLLSILFPLLKKARNQAHVVVCASLQKDLFTVHYSYFTENGELLPISMSVNDSIMQPWTTYDFVRKHLELPVLDKEYKRNRWPENIQEYKPAYPRKFICPSASYALRNDEDGLYPIDRSYGLNAHPYYLPVTVRNKLIHQTAEHVFLADALDWWFSYWECDKYTQYGETWMRFPTYGMAAFRHSGKANACYWDGHCERISSDELKDRLKFWLSIF
jgi:prepilin-type N-terminal cleavage/methylation domain-containing protein/prepilin-type processing-associated H-X9-DG protein